MLDELRRSGLFMVNHDLKEKAPAGRHKSPVSS